MGSRPLDAIVELTGGDSVRNRQGQVRDPSGPKAPGSPSCPPLPPAACDHCFISSTDDVAGNPPRQDCALIFHEVGVLLCFRLAEKFVWFFSTRCYRKKPSWTFWPTQEYNRASKKKKKQEQQTKVTGIIHTYFLHPVRGERMDKN